jgi:hypothetical protein
MIACPQTPTQNVLEHGKAVHAAWQQILQGEITSLPSWFYEYQKEILAEINRFDQESISCYQIYHDCGKPFCRTIDDQGQHFPDHATISAQVFEDIFGPSLACTWVQHDMDAHLLKATQVPEFCEIEGCIILLVTALAEIYANASMFGGTSSTSFKIKYKQLDRRGRAICKHLWGSRG